jgi:hypothetical protein
MALPPTAEGIRVWNNSSENARLEALWRYEVLDTEPDPAFDDPLRT